MKVIILISPYIIDVKPILCMLKLYKTKITHKQKNSPVIFFWLSFCIIPSEIVKKIEFSYQKSWFQASRQRHQQGFIIIPLTYHYLVPIVEFNFFPIINNNDCN